MSHSQHKITQPEGASLALASGSVDNWKVGELVWYSDWNAPRCLIVARFGNIVEVLTEYARRPEKRDGAHLMTRDRYRAECRRCSDGFGSGSWQEQMEKVTALDWQPPRTWTEWLQRNLQDQTA